MMREAFVFLLLFGCLLIFAAAALCLNRDPRKSVFFARVQGKLTKEEARRTARQIAAALGAKPIGVAAQTSLAAMRVNYFIREAIAVGYMKLAGTLY